jgi:hypothetical protein
MDALISAQAGTALLIDGANLTSIHANAPERAIPRRAEEVHLLFGEGFDLQVLEGISRDQVVHQLAREADSAEALQLSLILLDSELPGEIRSEAAEELDGLLAEKECREGLERVLYAHPFPAGADPSGAMAHSEGHALRVQDLLHQLIALQPSIADVLRAWTSLPDALFVNSTERRHLQTILVREGLFWELVLVRCARISIETFLVDALLKLPQYSEEIRAWAAPFHQDDRDYKQHKQHTTLEETKRFANLLREQSRSSKRQTLFNHVETEKASLARNWIDYYASRATKASATIPALTRNYLSPVTMVFNIGRIYRGENFTFADATAVAGAAGIVDSINPLSAGPPVVAAVLGIPSPLLILGWAIKAALAVGGRFPNENVVIKKQGEVIIKLFEHLEVFEKP